MIRFLLLLALVAQIVPPVQSLRSIDWNRCDVDAKCFVEGKCVTQFSVNNQSKEYYTIMQFAHPLKLKDYNCNVGVQIIPFSAYKVLIYMQVNGIELKNNKIGLYQNEIPMVGCEIKNDSVAVVEVANLNKKGKPVLYEDLSRFGDKHALCAVTIDKYDKFVKAVEAAIPTPQSSKSVLRVEPVDETPRPVASKPGEYEYVTSTARSHIFNRAPYEIKSCDPSSIKPTAPRPNYHVLQIKDPVRGEIDCSNYNDVDYEYRLFIQQGENITEPTKLDCDYATKNYKDITDQADFSAYCAVEMSKTCQDTFNCTHPTDCPTFNSGTANENAKLQCNNKKWLIAGEYYVGFQPECKDDEIVQNKASFYMKLKEEMSKITEGQCFIDYDCRIKTKLDISENVLVTNESISCSTGKMRARYGNITYNATYYTCDKTTGEWRNKDEILEPNSRVLCEQEKALMVTQAVSIGLQAVVYVVIVAIAIPLAFMTLEGGCRLYYRRDHYKVKMYILFWRLISRDAKIRLADDAFAKILRVRSDSTVKIITGLKLIECLLKTETEDPEIWDLAYPFLTRFHGASRTRGNRLTGLFTRYLYLAAKKIIDKHGWISPNRITRAQHKGYIRTVAVRLIFYCRFNHYTEEVTKFIGEGFNKLRYEAVGQYPHCGMLWSHVASCRNRFMQERFMTDLHKISDGRELMDIPEEDRIAGIGNISEQAMAAIGGSLIFEGKQQWSAKLPKMATHGLGYIKGILRSSHLDMGIMMTILFGTGDHEVLERLVPKEDESSMNAFLDNVMFTMICYGQQQDAKRLENAYLKHIYDDDLKAEKSSVRFKRIESEQNFFKKTLSEEEKSIIKWLAARMDKKELRTKGPDFNIQPGAENVSNEEKKSDQAAFSNPASDSVLATDDAFFTALLQEPTVIPRIRTSQATEEEQTRYRALLAEIFAEDTIIAARVNFSPDDVMEVVSKVQDIVKTEPMLIEDVPGGITVVADLHGQLYDLDRVFKADSKDGKPGYECTKYLFTGDYVDRGYMSLEVVMALFILKILYPDRIFLLRGNHEFANVNARHGFGKTEMDSRYNKDVAPLLYLRINECFCYLSIAGIIGNKFFCAHGGISFGSFTRHEMRRLEKPYYRLRQDPIVDDVTWTDPALCLKGVCLNDSRFFGFFYGEDECIHGLENIGCEALIRGHSIMNAGYAIEWNRLLCLYTATCNNRQNDKGAVAVVDENLTVNLRVFKEDFTKYEVADDYERKRKYGDNAADVVVAEDETEVTGPGQGQVHAIN